MQNIVVLTHYCHYYKCTNFFLMKILFNKIILHVKYITKFFKYFLRSNKYKNNLELFANQNKFGVEGNTFFFLSYLAPLGRT